MPAPDNASSDSPPLDSASGDGLPNALWSGVEQFNRGDYYDCHDTLEALWMAASTVEKPFYQGILQIAVGLYHLQNHNWRGAAILLGEGSSRLLPFEPTYEQIDVTDLIDQTADWLTALQQSGPEAVAEVAAQLKAHPDAEDRLGDRLSVPNIRRLSDQV